MCGYPSNRRISMTYKTTAVDHLGIVAATCDEIGLIQTIDSIVGADEQQKVTTGESVMAMVINALGFVSKPLYLFPEFMEKKPISLLFGKERIHEDFNDDTLGRALDRLYEHDPTNIFMKVSLNASKIFGIKRRFYHLDTTSITVHGEYKYSEDDMYPIYLTHGKSKDGRDDLKQYIISMITSSEPDMPAWISALSGNTSDNTHFREVIRKYAKQLAENDEEIFFIMDAAWYSEKNIHETPGMVKWISRVPESIASAKQLLLDTDEETLQQSCLKGYRLKVVQNSYAGEKQQWVVVLSQQSYEKEIKTLQRNIEKEKMKVKKELWHFGNKEFSCEEDALKMLMYKEKKWKYHKLQDHTVITKMKSRKRGRPKKNSNDVKKIYQIKTTFEPDNLAIMTEKKRKGKFILATNDTKLDGETILAEYKNQQSVERGFRFIKDPLFFTSSTFLKKPQRIVSLVMIMGLSLLIYSIAQMKLRKALKQYNETIPDQKRKPTNRPTMRWIFQMFEGIHLLEISEDGKIKEMILNLKDVQKKILRLLGESYEKIYLLQ